MSGWQEGGLDGAMAMDLNLSTGLLKLQ